MSKAFSLPDWRSQPYRLCRRRKCAIRSPRPYPHSCVLYGAGTHSPGRAIDKALTASTHDWFSGTSAATARTRCVFGCKPGGVAFFLECSGCLKDQPLAKPGDPDIRASQMLSGSVGNGAYALHGGAVLTPKSAQSCETGGALHFAIDQEIVAPICLGSPPAARLGACRQQIIGSVMRILPRAQSCSFLLGQRPAAAGIRCSTPAYAHHPSVARY